MSEPSGDNLLSLPQPADDAPPPLASDRLPVSVRVIAWIWLILDVSSLVEMFLDCFVVGRGLNLNIGVLGIFIGRGLLLRRQRWLSVARGCGMLLLGMLVLGIIFWIGFFFWAFGLVDATNVTWNGPPALLILTLLGVTAYLFWHQRVLDRPEVCEIYLRAATAPPERRAGRFQFSLGTLLMLAVMAAFVLPQVMSEDVLYEHHFTTSVSKFDATGRKWEVHVGYRSHRFLTRPDKLEYVVFLSHTGQSDYQIAQTYASDSGPREILFAPEDTKITLPTDHQLIECIDGRYRESPERVTKAQLDAFLASNPAEYTIDALLEFAKTHPQ